MPTPIERLVARRVARLPQGLQDHIFRAHKIAVELAGRHGIDVEKASLGTLAHDIARSMKGEQLLQKARDLGLPVHPVEQQVPVLLHGPVGAETLRQVDGLDDDEIYEAVCWHSTAHNGLSTTAKIVFLADKLDPQKEARYPYLPLIRDLAMESLDDAIVEFLSREIATLVKGGHLVHPLSIEARNELLLVKRHPADPSHTKLPDC